MLGLATSFIVFLALAIALSYYTNNPWNGVTVMLIYIIVKIIWRILK